VDRVFSPFTDVGVSADEQRGVAVRKRFNLGGQEVSGEEVEFETEREGWNI
jgi:hypothetical protein